MTCYEIGFGVRVSVAIVLETFLKLDFQRFVFVRNVRMGIQIIAKQNLVVVALSTKMQMENSVGESLGGIPFVETHSRVACRHKSVTDRFYEGLHPVERYSVCDLQQNVDYRFGAYSFDGGAAYVANAFRVAAQGV